MSRALTELYRLVYEWITILISSKQSHDQSDNYLLAEYNKLVALYPSILKQMIMRKGKRNYQTLVSIITQLLQSESEHAIYNDVYNLYKDRNRGGALFRYCQAGEIDGALLLLLDCKFKNESRSCKQTVNYCQADETIGAAIHEAIEYAQILISRKYAKGNCKYDRTILLIELLLREGASTSLVKGAYTDDDETVLYQAMATDNMDVLRVIFKYGVDIDINIHKSSSSRRCTMKPIHFAIERNSYELTRMLIARGADINAYRSFTLFDEYGDVNDTQMTALHYNVLWMEDDNKMLKLILGEHQQKHHGIPDVNKMSCICNHVEAEFPEEPSGDDDEESDGDENFLTYETAIHVAVGHGNIEAIKLLLIYGADASLYRIKTRSAYSRIFGSWRCADYDYKMAKLLKDFNTEFIDKYKKTGILADAFESVQDVYQILNEAENVDVKVKQQIKRVFELGSIWFPDMIDLYPNNMGKALQTITTSLIDALPVEIVNIVVAYFYNIVDSDSIK